MIALILLKLLAFSQILQGVHKLLSSTVYRYRRIEQQNNRQTWGLGARGGRLAPLAMSSGGRWGGRSMISIISSFKKETCISKLRFNIQAVFCNHKSRPGTINPSVALLFSLLFAAQISGLGRKDEEEGRIVVVSDPVLIQGFSVLGETLPDHPTLEGRVEIIVTIDLKNKLGMRAQVKL